MNNTQISFQKRMVCIFLILLAVFMLILFRLGYVQFISGGWLQAQVSAQWMRELPLNANRGIIYDANGNILATNYSTYDVYVRASMVQDANAVAHVLNKYLGIAYEVALTKAQDKSISESLIKLQVPTETAEKIIDENIPGILLSENSRRYYTYGDLLTQVLGYTTIDNIGQSGLEAYYNKYLTGVDGYVLDQSDVHGVKIENTMSHYIPSIAGCNLNLTIDVDIQIACENALKKLCEEQKPKTATAIVMDPNTGAILAMSTKPSFDLNNIPRDNLTELMKNSKNISIVDVYEPGSTFKVLTTATALEEGVTTELEHFYDPGYRIVDGQKIKCWKHIGHGSQTMEEGLCNSCNSVFIDLALRLGKEKMYQYFEKYGFGNLTNIDFAAESGGILLDYDRAENVDVARMGFGQAIAVTPLQQIRALCSVLNGGYLLEPYFVSSITDANNKTIYKKDRTVVGRTISEETSARVRSMMEKVLIKSNAIEAFIPGYRVSGKTGTSYKYENGVVVDKFVSSFAGAFPADKPEYVVLVIVDEPSAGAYFGSVVATPYAKMIIQDIINYKGYKPNENLESDLKLMEKTIEMPSLYGLSLTEACTKLTSLGLQYEIAGEGEYVVEQTPTPGTMLYKNAVVIITTE